MWIGLHIEHFYDFKFPFLHFTPQVRAPFERTSEQSPRANVTEHDWTSEKLRQVPNPEP